MVDKVSQQFIQPLENKQLQRRDLHKALSVATVNRGKETRKELSRLLTYYSFFRSLGQNARELFCRQVTLMVLNKEQVLFKSYNKAENVYIVTSGNCKVIYNNQTICTETEGAVFGEQACLHGIPYIKTIYAMSSKVYFLVIVEKIILKVVPKIEKN